MVANLSGIILLDKPLDMTSNGALQRVKKLCHVDKAGHTGSLDPRASGMLPICIGRATRFAQYLLETDKRYLVTGKLGAVTSSGDSETPVLEVRPLPANLTLHSVEKVLDRFRGKIRQLPPMHSAIKHNGKPLYALARQGIEVERSPREVQIFELTLRELTSDSFTLAVHCSKGTYIRTLVSDIGEALGCGAYTIMLRRVGVGSFTESQMVPLKELEEMSDAERSAQLLPLGMMLQQFISFEVNDDLLYYLRRGQPVLAVSAPKEGLVRIHAKDGRFCGIGEIQEDGLLVPRRLV